MTIPAAIDGAASEITSPNLTLSQIAYRQIRRDIINGDLGPSIPLRLEALKKRYGLSFSPIREALNRLQSERLVVSAALRGFSVAPLSIDEIRDTTEVRILIECHALRRSLRNGGDAWEARIVASFHALTWIAKRTSEKKIKPSIDEAEALEMRHRDFHHALIACCDSPKLLDLADQLYTQTERYRRPVLLVRDIARATRNVSVEHKKLMDASLRRDASKACALLTEHYRATAIQIEGLLDRVRG